MAEDLILSAWRGHEQFAEWLVRRLRPRVVVDLGVDYGFSSFVFARAGAERVYAIDSFEGDPEAGVRDTYEAVQENMKRLGITNVELVRGRFDDVAATWDRQIDILHIDGSHRYEDVKRDYETWRKFVSPSGVILLHDTAELDEPYGVHRLFAEIELPKVEFAHSHGLGVVSADSGLISEVNRAHCLWFSRGEPWYWIKRAIRKLKRNLLRLPGPEF